MWVLQSFLHYKINYHSTMNICQALCLDINKQWKKGKSPHKALWIYTLPPPPTLLSYPPVGIPPFNISVQSGLFCCFLESGELSGVSTGDRCGQTSSRRQCIGRVLRQSGNGGVGRAHLTGRTCQNMETRCYFLKK